MSRDLERRISAGARLILRQITLYGQCLDNRTALDIDGYSAADHVSQLMGSPQRRK